MIPLTRSKPNQPGSIAPRSGSGSTGSGDTYNNNNNNNNNNMFYFEPFDPTGGCTGCIWSTPGQCRAANFCSTLKSCDTCTSNPSCGWCSDLGACLPAKLKKPCLAGFDCKYWAYGSCEVDCNSHSDCAHCLQSNGRCEWCAGGQLNNRTTSYCTLRNQLPQPICINTFQESCPSCGLQPNCTACNAHPSCGWCSNPNFNLSRCVEGNRQGPFDPSDCLNNPSNPLQGWINHCQPWNTTTPITPPTTPVSPPMTPITPPTTPVSPPMTPITPPHAIPESPPPTIPPTAPEPMTEPIEPPQSEPIPPVPAPIAVPVAPVPEPQVDPPKQPTEPPTPPIDPPKHTPQEIFEPFMDRLRRFYRTGAIVGVSIGVGLVIIGGIIWYKVHQSATYRYRAIG